jgi:hypothetical protein
VRPASSLLRYSARTATTLPRSHPGKADCPCGPASGWARAPWRTGGCSSSIKEQRCERRRSVLLLRLRCGAGRVVLFAGRVARIASRTVRERSAVLR